MWALDHPYHEEPDGVDVLLQELREYAARAHVGPS